MRHTVWAKALTEKEGKLIDELAAEIATGKLASSELEAEAEKVEEAVEDSVEEVEPDLEAVSDEIEEAAAEVEMLDEENIPEGKPLPEVDLKLEDDISSYPND